MPLLEKYEKQIFCCSCLYMHNEIVKIFLFQTISLYFGVTRVDKMVNIWLPQPEHVIV